MCPSGVFSRQPSKTMVRVLLLKSSIHSWEGDAAVPLQAISLMTTSRGAAVESGAGGGGQGEVKTLLTALGVPFKGRPSASTPLRVTPSLDRQEDLSDPSAAGFTRSRLRK